MFDDAALHGISIVVAGAGLAGLTAALDLRERGALVTVVEARDRVGGRVWTIRDGFRGKQHAEAGGDLIDEGQHAILDLAGQLGVKPVRILRTGFAAVRQGANPAAPHVAGRAGESWIKLRERLEPLIRRYDVVEGREESPIVRTMARTSVAEWLARTGAGPDLHAAARSLRGFFLADPEDLSLLALVDELASEVPGRGKMFRISGGNDQLATRAAAVLGDRVRLRTIVQAVNQFEGNLQVTVSTEEGEAAIPAHYAVLAVPATVVQDIQFRPDLPALQRDAFHRLKYGRATKSMLQFTRRFWRSFGRSRAYGTDLPIGAIWEANEEQRGREGILTVLAGGKASDETRGILAAGGPEALAARLDWLGRRETELIAARVVSWEDDPWARGGYAYFDPDYDPALRSWLARPHGRVVFAGEHTSLKWQGYMNGAVESGLRASAEVLLLAAGHPPPADEAAPGDAATGRKPKRDGRG
jgi:monoamine oxidase